MHDRFIPHALLSCLSLLFLVSPAAYAAEYPNEPVTIKLEGAEMTPVTFSHDTHVMEIDCAKCHHMDAQNPGACTACHGSAAENGMPAAKDVFHMRCQTCHKEMEAKGIPAPTQCDGCHKT